MCSCSGINTTDDPVTTSGSRLQQYDELDSDVLVSVNDIKTVPVPDTEINLPPAGYEAARDRSSRPFSAPADRLPGGRPSLPATAQSVELHDRQPCDNLAQRGDDVHCFKYPAELRGQEIAHGSGRERPAINPFYAGGGGLVVYRVDASRDPIVAMYGFTASPGWLKL